MNIRFGWTFVAACLASLALAQGPEKPEFSGIIEQFFASGGFGDSHKTRDRFTRILGKVEWGKWEAKASFWYYPYCFWHERDETTIAYTEGNTRMRVGRFILPIGQATWDDQWYSGLVYIPHIQFANYQGRKILERTSVGAEIEHQMGPHQVKLALTSPRAEVNHILPSKWTRGTVRLSTYRDGVTYGVSAFADTESFGDDERLLAADIRLTRPQWVLRGEIIDYRSPGQKRSGYYIDLYVRPKGWTTVTFVGRYEVLRTKTASFSRRELWTAGAKFRLPEDIFFLANYTGGPDMNRIFLGGNWAFGLSKAVRF
jgi:hypothetical protein